MKIILDINGGDKKIDEAVIGAYKAATKYNVDIILIGPKYEILNILNKNNIDKSFFKIVDCNKTMKIEDDATTILKSNIDTSMGLSLQMLSEGRADALVSSGSTAALVIGSTFIVNRIKGIKRPALAPLVPSYNNPYMLIDAGANVDCKESILYQFALMGSIYMKNVFNINKPKVGILNIGSEQNKGRDIEISTFNSLSKSNLNFYGNIEARELAFGVCDVVVTDGFTGNIALKTVEGMGKMFNETLKDIFLKNTKTKLAAFLVKSDIMKIKKKFDYKEQGGAIVIGVKKPVIKAHGSSDGIAFENAIRQAKIVVEKNVCVNIENSLNEGNNG